MQFSDAIQDEELDDVITAGQRDANTLWESTSLDIFAVTINIAWSRESSSTRQKPGREKLLLCDGFAWNVISGAAEVLAGIEVTLRPGSVRVGAQTLYMSTNV